MRDGRQVVVLARTLTEARAARREAVRHLPELKGARLVSSYGGRSASGQSAHRVYVVPDAEKGPYYLQCVAVLRQNLRKTPGADVDIRMLSAASRSPEHAVEVGTGG